MSGAARRKQAADYITESMRMKKTVTRRQALVGVSSSLLLPAACSTLPSQDDRQANSVFMHGVASGDPDATSIVLWTRVSGSSGNVTVDWSISSDPDFQNIVSSGNTSTGGHRDHTVKVVAGELAPGRDYFYRFAANGVQSPIGRTKTLPEGRVDELVIAVTSCSNYQFGFFNAYETIAEDSAIDIVVHLGDYIYEYDENSYGGPIGQRIGRTHSPRHEMVSLSDYRQRHAQYKADENSQAMHARHPLVATWDDHETTNNPWTGGAQNHQPDEGSWLDRRSASLQAYYEWMPIREPGPGGSREALWRHYRFGDLVSLITLESRHTARSQQIEIGDYQDELTSPEKAQDFYNKVVGDERRRLLSDDMEEFLRIELAESVESGRQWRVIANQTILAKVTAPKLTGDAVFEKTRETLDESSRGLLDSLTGYGNLELAANMDAWDGYPAARERFYRIADENDARDLLVITGDTHIFWQNSLADAAGTPMGVELGTSAVTSPRGFYQLGDDATVRFDQLTTEQNDSVEWMDGRYRGYIRLTLDRSYANAEFISVNNIESKNYAVRTLRSSRIVKKNGTLGYG